MYIIKSCQAWTYLLNPYHSFLPQGFLQEIQILLQAPELLFWLSSVPTSHVSSVYCLYIEISGGTV